MAEVRLRRQIIVPRLKVEGYRHLHVPNVSPGQRYTLLVYVPDAKHMRQILGVEVSRKSCLMLPGFHFTKMNCVSHTYLFYSLFIYFQVDDIVYEC